MENPVKTGRARKKREENAKNVKIVILSRHGLVLAPLEKGWKRGPDSLSVFGVFQKKCTFAFYAGLPAMGFVAGRLRHSLASKTKTLKINRNYEFP